MDAREEEFVSSVRFAIAKNGGGSAGILPAGCLAHTFRRAKL
jgi:hypothetical protein